MMGIRKEFALSLALGLAACFTSQASAQPYTIGGAIYSNCSDPIGSGEAGVAVHVACDGGYTCDATSAGNQGIWLCTGVPQGNCSVTVEGTCHVSTGCPPDPCSTSVSIVANDANQGPNQSLVFLYHGGTGPICGDGTCDLGESQSNCCEDCGCPAGESCQGDECVAILCSSEPYTIGGAVYSDCSDPIGSGVAGVSVSVACNGGFTGTATTAGNQGIWSLPGVPCDTCTITVGGTCSVGSTCPPEPCNDSVTIDVDDANQGPNQSLGFWEDATVPECNNGTCEAGEDSCTCPNDCGTPPSTESICDDEIDNDCDGSVDGADDDCAQPTFTIGGALFSDCSDPLGSGQAGITVNVSCDGGFSGSTTSFGGQGLWGVANVPEDACCVTAVGFCSVDSVCPPDPCDDTVCIAVDAAHQAENQSLAFWECVDGECVPACHWAIVTSDPPSGAIDAREPHSVSDASDVSGWSSVELTMGGIVGSCAIDDFSISEVGGGPPLPVLVAVDPVSEFSVRVDLDRPIEPGAWTVITHKSSGSKVCLGFLPADASQNLLSSTGDISALIDSINLVPGRVLPDYATDINRSGITNGQDILRLIDLLNGADAFAPWITQSLPANPCDP